MIKGRRLTMRLLLMTMLLVAVFAMISCSGANPAAPGADFSEKARDGFESESNRWNWGNWRMYVPEDHSRLEITPIRNADLHYNVKMLLENGPCDNCIWVSKFVNNGDGTISVDISIRHPYPGNDYYTGFDVRGIFYTTANYHIKMPEDEYGLVRIPSLSTGDPELLNPDGFTGAYAPFEDQVFGPIFYYQPGGDLGATLEKEDLGIYSSWIEFPYINYYSFEQRRAFTSGATLTSTYHVALPPGEWEFGYSVDACWAKPTNIPVTNIVTDFPEQANTLMPYRLDAFVSGPLIGQEPQELTVRVYHHIPDLLPYFDRIHVDARTFWSGVYVHDPVIVDDKYVEFKWEFANWYDTPPGKYAMEIQYRAEDAFTAYVHELETTCYRNAQIQQFVWVTIE